MTFNRSRINLSSQLSVEPSISFNWIDLPTGPFTTKLVGGARHLHDDAAACSPARSSSTTRRTHTVSANARLRWEYRPGSELFVVYNEERDSEAAAWDARPAEPRVHREGKPVPPVLGRRHSMELAGAALAAR